MATMSTGGMRLMHSPLAAESSTSKYTAADPSNDSASAFGFANNYESQQNPHPSSNNGLVIINNSNSGGVNINAPQLMICTPKDATVDYDVNVTPLYEYIGDSNWKAATERCWQCPKEASTWVVRYRRDVSGNKMPSSGGGNNVLWRFLPIHSACALNPPTSFVRALLQCHPQGTRTLDDQGMLPLHYACGARCSREVLYLLLMSFPQAALRSDPNGMLPLHYLAQWGPSEPGVIDMVCVATGHKVGGGCMDGDGNTAEMLAMKATYLGHEDVARKIRDFESRFLKDAVAASPTAGSDNGSIVGGLTLSPSLVAIDNALGGGGGGAPRSPMSASSYRNRGGSRTLTVQTAFTPRNQHQRHNSAPTDKYSSFEDNGTEDNDILIVNNNNENDSNLWNMTPQSGRQVMHKLGVSPTRNYLQANGGGGNKYLSPNFPLDLTCPTNCRKDPAPDAEATDSATRDFRSRHSPRNITRLDPPAATPSGGARRSSSTPRNFGPTLKDTSSIRSMTNVVPKPATTTTSINANADRTPNETSRVKTNILSNKSTTNNSRSVYNPRYGSFASSYSATTGLPPKSPRVLQTPKNFYLNDSFGIGLGGGKQYTSNQAQHQESREPISDSDRQDRRLAELREELSSIRASGGGGVSNYIDGRQPNRNLPYASVRFEDNEAREPPPQSNETNSVSGGSFAISSMSWGHSGGVHGSSNSNMSNGTNLTQQDVFEEAGNRPNDNEKEINAAIHTSQREKALMKELDMLRSEKELAEEALNNIAMIGGTLENCISGDGSDYVSKRGEVEKNDDEVSKLTFQNEFDHVEGVETIGSPRMKMGRCADVTTNAIIVGVDRVTSSKGSIENDMERLMREKKKIDLAIQQAVNIQRNKELNELSNASNASTGKSSDILEEALKKIAELTEQVLSEQKKSTELEQQVLSLKDEKEFTKRSHTEAVSNHLKEVQSLRECFDKAKVEIDKYRDDAKDALEVKEQEWNEERRILLENVENHKVRCIMAQTEIEEYREDAKSLREGFDKAKVDIDKYRDDAQRALIAKELEWNEERRVLEEQIKNLEVELSLAQNGEQNVRALVEENELKWKEERGRLETEIQLLKESISDGLKRSLSMASTMKSDCKNEVSVTDDVSSTSMFHLRMQLANAVTEAEEMRKFNTAIRREHDKTVEALESELKEERKSKTESLSQIVTLQYKIASLQQEMEYAKEDNRKERLIMLEPTPSSRSRGCVSFPSSSEEDDSEYSRERPMLEPTPSSRSRGSVNFGGSSNDSQSYRTLEMEVYMLKDKLREKVDEAQKYRRELDATKKLVEEMDYLPCQSSLTMGDDKSEKYLEQICDLKKKIAQLKQMEIAQAHQLREEKMLHEHALLDKEDDCNEKIRDLKNKHELELIRMKDLSRAELREQEAKFLQNISDREKKEQESSLGADSYTAREIDKIVKQKDENHEKRIKKIISEKDEMIATKEKEFENKVAELEDEIKTLKDIIKKKDKEFEVTVAELEAEVETLRRKLDATLIDAAQPLKDIIKKKDKEFEVTVAGLEDEIETLRRKLDATVLDAAQYEREQHEKQQHEKELRECKRELDRQRRNHRSEMNQLKNTLEMQKSKQERLQSHIQSLEKQISEMVNDYEEKLLRAYYDKC
ncbi:hypothetical protein ACHAXA_007991 [Cyclostephanos tholiformis]|uniref:Uncharacterized protein n=1 Tax=Cyclostephanos tholiformis TaxID=382380 RepID=A0ABD3R8K7_9STRA